MKESLNKIAYMSRAVTIFMALFLTFFNVDESPDGNGAKRSGRE